MSALSNIPRHAVLPLGAYDKAGLERAALRADQILLRCDCSGADSKAAVLKAMGEGFGLPPYYGGNLDALHDCLTDLKPSDDASSPGFVVLIENLPDASVLPNDERSAVLDVFRDAADFFYDENIAFRVFYSVRKPAEVSG
ncbi:MAG: barstar family protein [Lautropia sp.]|nr:barstar family protein [Lautropia sp.]